MDSLLRAKFRVNIHSLVAESKYIRKQEKKFKKNPVVRCQLRKHRVNNIREELRITNLAYAACRHLPYQTVEPRTKKPLTGEQMHRIQLKVKRKGVEDVNIKEWLKV